VDTIADARPPSGDEMLTLYEHPFALYCQKVLIALEEQRIAYDVLEEQRDFDRAELAKLWPPASIPVLRDGEQVIGETSIIIEHVAGSRLVPSLEARKWDRICDQYVSDAVQAIVSDTIQGRSDGRAVVQARSRLDMAYGMLDVQLAGNQFLAGDTFTIADCAAAPGLFYALAIHPWDEGTHPHLTGYYRALAQRPSFAKVIADARPYRHLFPLPWPDDFDRHH
jgi:glutathione S-transferase